MAFIIDYLLQDNHYMSILGIGVILGVAFLFSRHKKRIKLRLIFSAMIMQLILSFIILKTTLGRDIFIQISQGFKALYEFADSGCAFVFGNLANAGGPWGFIFAIKVVPVIIFFGALMSLMYHIGLVQILVKGLAWIIRPILGTSGAETLSVAANSMLGQTEAPLLVRHYLARMTNSEMLTVMVSGMAHLSGAIMAVYGMMGVPLVHLISASIMAIPGAILISKILIPETEVPETMAGSNVKMEKTASNVLDAVASGTGDGLRLAVNVAAMLIAFISLIALVDYVLFASTSFLISYNLLPFLSEPLSLNCLFAQIFRWVALLIGVPWGDSGTAGALLGKKLVINEFVAYSDFAKSLLTDRSKAILTYALAGFSNFSCIGIQIGGLGAICPEKRTTLTKLGLTALLGGTLANLLNAAIVSLFI
ncbi:MAG: nucleoside transporter C-terminal domain-containing protein [Candidatus Babeliales bacterium]|jgi:CNT family concentrative nucleoside transporter